jgi:hypothetical protein
VASFGYDFKALPCLLPHRLFASDLSRVLFGGFLLLLYHLGNCIEVDCAEFVYFHSHRIRLDHHHHGAHQEPRAR